MSLLQSSHGEDTKYYDIGERRTSPPRYERSILERLHKVLLAPCPASAAFCKMAPPCWQIWNVHSETDLILVMTGQGNLKACKPKFGSN